MHDEHDPLLAALAETTPEGASAGFTERVLAGYAARRRRRAAIRGITAVALLAAAAGLVWMQTTTPGVEPELQTLEAERRQLAQELARLQELARTTRPVAWVHAGEDVDVVLDLRRLDSTSGLDVRPARNTARSPGQ